MASQETPMQATAPSGLQPDNVSLRIITLAHGSSGENDLYLVFSLDTKIGELKDRLQEALPQHPRPDCQRLIYQGRPLLDNNAALRSILRLQPTNQDPSAAHVLHLVVRQDQAQNATPTPTTRAQTVQTPQPVPQGLHPLPQAQPPFFPQPGVQGINAVQAIMQQHMAMHNRNIANAHPVHPVHPVHPTHPVHPAHPTHPVHPAHPTHPVHPVHPAHAALLHNNAANIPYLPGIGGLPTPLQPTINHGQPQPQRLEMTASTIPEMNPDAHTASEQTTVHHGMTTRIQETIGPNGERIRTVVNTGSFMPNHLHNLQPNPEERSASAPPRAQPSAGSTTVEQPQDPVLTAMFPGLPLPNFPAAGRPTIQSFNTNFGLQPNSRPILAPTAWLLSSPSGPQALVFAPGHGNFSTIPVQQPSATTERSHLNTTQDHQNPQPEIVQIPQDNTARNDAPNAAPLQVMVRPAGQAQDHAQAQGPVRVQPGRPEAREGEDLLALILQRGWLFLRLYMFIFVLSESGTWRRIALLSLAVFVCLLPRRNPFTDGFNAARRHVDNLIGPPQLPQPEDQPAPGGNPGQNRAVNGQQPRSNQDAAITTSEGANTANRQSRRSQMPSPEEHARRLLREHQAQNPSFIRGLLYSIEQAVALFLASLIPGVGERHVRAREDARRIVQEIEERRLREIEQSNQQVASPSNGESAATSAGAESKKEETNIPTSSSAGTDAPASTSTGVEINASGSNTLPSQYSSEGIRQRSGEGSTSTSHAAGPSSVS